MSGDIQFGKRYRLKAGHPRDFASHVTPVQWMSPRCDAVELDTPQGYGRNADAGWFLNHYELDVVQPSPDPVSHPPHYNSGPIEAIDAIRSALGDEGFKAYCQGNAMKYLWRCGKKDDAVQDIDKAIWYAKKLKEVIE